MPDPIHIPSLPALVAAESTGKLASHGPREKWSRFGQRAAGLLKRYRRAIAFLVEKRTGGVFTKEDIPPPAQVAGAREWQRRLSLWRRKWTPLDPLYRGQLPKEAFFYPHPSLEGAEWLLQDFEVPETFVLQIPFGRVLGRHGAVVSDDNVLLSDLSRTFTHQSPDHYLLHQQRVSRLRRREGRFAVINGVGDSTYHWLYDCLPRFELLRLAGFDLDAFDGFFMNRPKYEAHYKTLELLGIPLSKIVWCTQSSHFGCDRLVVPSFSGNRRQHHPWVYPFLRKMAGLPVQAGGQTKRRRIFISRKDAPTAIRRIVNEAEILAVLKKYGFEEVVLGGLDFAEQVHLFASAEFVVAPHGGGLSNLCFCNRPAKVLELFAPDYTRTDFRSIARQMGFAYEALVGEHVPCPGEKLNGGDMRIEPGKIRQIMEAML